MTIPVTSDILANVGNEGDKGTKNVVTDVSLRATANTVILTRTYGTFTSNCATNCSTNCSNCTGTRN